MEEKKEFESVLILKGTFTEEEYKKAFENIKVFFEKYEVEKIEEIGKKRLAYEIKGITEGYYIIIEFKALREDITDIERYYRINDDVLKFIIVKS